jgi:hypothetical protein
MATITFTLGFKTAGMRDLSLPIEVRKHNSTLVAHTVATKPVEVRPGRYYATASLPGGQQLLQAFEVSPQDHALTIELVPDDEDRSSKDWQEAAHYLQAAKGSTWRVRSTAQDMVATGAESMATLSSVPALAPVKARARLFSGNPVTGALTPQPWFAHIVNVEQGAVVQFKVDKQDQSLIAQLIEPGGPVHNMMVPATPCNSALLVFARRPDGTCRMEVHLENSTADMLLRYSAASATTAAEEAGLALLRDAERLISDKRRDPVSAAVGAAAILRFGKLEWLHKWTANLDDWFRWLPDGAAIHGEHLARKGKHAEAAIRFCEVPRRGLPFISDALFYTVERLKWYTDLKPQNAGGIDQASAREALERLLPFASLAHRQRALTSFPGVDPWRPSADLGAAADSSGTIELAQWLD